MTSYAILIDGGFLKRKLGTAKKPAVSADVELFVSRLCDSQQLQGMRLHRIYFYDSQPLSGSEAKPLDGSVIDFGNHPSVARNKALHSALIHIPYMALRLGDLAFRGWEVKRRTLASASGTVTIGPDDLAPDIQQKGVDMRIGLDIAALTLKHQVDVIVLVTGDSDFVPAMKFARREGAQLFLVPMGHSIKESMREHADLVISTQ